MRTKSALAVSEAMGAAPLPSRGLSPGLSTERPRSTSKSEEKTGLARACASAEAISCCSSGDGAHTFSMCTLTCGFGGALASCAEQKNDSARMATTTRILLNTAKLYQQRTRGGGRPRLPERTKIADFGGREKLRVRIRL